MKCKECGTYCSYQPSGLCDDCFYDDDIDDNDIFDDDDIFDTDDFDDECEICGKPSYGYPLCRDCYYTNNNKIYEKEFQNKHTAQLPYEQISCQDGHIVKSRGESMIDDWLYTNNVLHAYEKPLSLPTLEKPLKPDFYLSEYNAYIEFWGMENPEYLKQKEFKIKHYELNNIKVFNIYNKKISEYNTKLTEILHKLKKQGK